MEKNMNEALNLFEGLYDDGENVVKTLEKINIDGNEELTRLIKEFKEGQDEMRSYLDRLSKKYKKE